MCNQLSRSAKLKAQTAYFKTFKACSSCRENCHDDNMSCSVCCKIFHPKCVSLSKNNNNTEKIAKSLICSSKCISSFLPFYFGDDIDFFSALFGEGKYPCKKCKRDCLDNMNCISCSACHTWHHLECTKLTKDEFETKTFFFCNKRCEKSVELPTTYHDSSGEPNSNSCCCDQSIENPKLSESEKQEEKRKKKSTKKSQLRGSQ